MIKTSTVPNNLRHQRERVGLRQTDIAKLLGLQCSDRLSRWEHGIAMPSVVNLFKLAVLYGVAPQELYPELFSRVEEGAASTGVSEEGPEVTGNVLNTVVASGTS